MHTYLHAVTVLTDPKCSDLIFSIDKRGLWQNLTEKYVEQHEEVFWRVWRTSCNVSSRMNNIMAEISLTWKALGVHIIIVPQLDKCLKFKSFLGDKTDCTLYKVTPWNVWGAICIFILYTKYLFYILNIHSAFHVFVLYFKCLFYILNIYSELQIFVLYSKNVLYVTNSCSLFQIFVLIAKYLC